MLRSLFMVRSMPLVLCVMAAGSANRLDAAGPDAFFYVGEVKLSSAEGLALGSQVILFEKRHDPEKSTIVESAVVVHPDGKVEERTMRVKVTGNNFTLADDAKTIEGTGTLSGPAWNWTYFRASYKSLQFLTNV